jgi:hypothetical protein
VWQAQQMQRLHPTTSFRTPCGPPAVAGRRCQGPEYARLLLPATPAPAPAPVPRKRSRSPDSRSRSSSDDEDDDDDDRHGRSRKRHKSSSDHTSSSSSSSRKKKKKSKKERRERGKSRTVGAGRNFIDYPLRKYTKTRRLGYMKLSDPGMAGKAGSCGDGVPQRRGRARAAWTACGPLARVLIKAMRIWCLFSYVLLLTIRSIGRHFIKRIKIENMH